MRSGSHLQLVRSELCIHGCFTLQQAGKVQVAPENSRENSNIGSILPTYHINANALTTEHDSGSYTALLRCASAVTDDRDTGASAGRMKLVGGKLVRSGIDVYLVMEHCGGGDLHELRGQLTAGQIRSLMHQLLTAVQYMHGLNVWHRDLKSANVLLTVHEGRHIAKVADLGAPLRLLLSFASLYSALRWSALYIWSRAPGPRGACPCQVWAPEGSLGDVTESSTTPTPWEPGPGRPIPPLTIAFCT